MFNEDIPSLKIAESTDLLVKYRLETLRNAFTRIRRPGNSCVATINSIGVFSIKILNDSKVFLAESIVKPLLDDD